MSFWMQTGMLVALLLNEIVIIWDNMRYRPQLFLLGFSLLLAILDVALLYVTLYAHTVYFPSWLSILTIIITSLNTVRVLNVSTNRRS